MYPIVRIDAVSYEVRRHKILDGISFVIEPRSWTAVLGENGAGKTTLLDLIMGFKKPSAGRITVLSGEPKDDIWADRQNISYLSEKVDIPGDWSVAEFLDFNAHFYPLYDRALESEFCKVFHVTKNSRVGNLSAGEIRRAQVVAALAYHPKLIVIDEITAVLDIVGRRRLMKVLKELTTSGAAILFATNILEGLHGNFTDLLIMEAGKLKSRKHAEVIKAATSEAQFFDRVADALEGVGT